MLAETNPIKGRRLEKCYLTLRSTPSGSPERQAFDFSKLLIRKHYRGKRLRSIGLRRPYLITTIYYKWQSQDEYIHESNL